MEVGVPALVVNHTDHLAPFHAVVLIHLKLVYVPVSGIDRRSIPQLMSEHHDPALTADLLYHIDSPAGHGVNRFAAGSPECHLPGRVEPKPVLTGVVKFTERHFHSIPILEAFGCIAQRRILHAKARVHVERPGDTAYIGTITVGIQWKGKAVRRQGGWNSLIVQRGTLAVAGGLE